jgi:predicted aspartyl protease
VHEQHDLISDHAFRDVNDDRDVRLAGESVPYNAYVVEVNPAGGRHEWLYIEKRTGNVVRREYVERRRRYVTTYDDYRLVDGVSEPSRVRTVDSLGNEREQTLVTRTLDTTPDPRDVEMPVSRHLVEFPNSPAPVRLPVRFVNGLTVVRLIVGRGAYDFLLDSGAAGIVVDPSIVDQQHLERYGQHVATTLGSFPETTTIVPQITVGPLRMRNVVARVVTVPFHLDEHTHVAGLLGFDFFADAVVHLELARNLAEALPPATFHAPPDAVPVALTLDDKTPAVRARIDNAVGRVVLDTGANRTIFETAFAERGDFAPERVASKTFVRGMGGFADAEAARVPAIDLGGLTSHDAMADISNLDLGADDTDGVLGSDLLRTFDLWFDYRTNTVYVRRAAKR